jgi:hypothetical protein
MIREISSQLGKKPDAIFCSVGGAGLLGGIIVGCKTSGWDDGKSNHEYMTLGHSHLLGCSTDRCAQHYWLGLFLSFYVPQ